MYIWQHANWTEFTYQAVKVKPLLQEVLDKQQQLIGKAIELPEALDHQVIINRASPLFFLGEADAFDFILDTLLPEHS